MPVSTQTRSQLHGLDLSLLDSTTPACDNFYQYACGGWLKQHPIPADHRAYGRGDEVMDNNELELKAILEKAAAPAAPGASRDPNEIKIGDDYAACMDTASIEAKGMDPLLSRVNRINLVFSKQQLPMVLAKLSNSIVEPFFRFTSDQDPGDATQVIAEFDQPSLGLPEKGYYLRTDEKSKTLRKQYTDHMASTFVLAGESKAQAGKDAAIVLDFETELAKASLSNEERRDPVALYHKTQLTAFSQTLSNFDLKTFLRDTGVGEVASMNVETPAYFARLNQLLASTDLATLKTFIRWNMLRDAPGLVMPAAFDQESFHFYGQILSGQPEQQPRWKRCVQQVDRQLGEALGEVYVAQYFSAQDKQRTQLLAADVEAAMGRDIDQLPWMSDVTKAQAKLKLKAVTNKIGYPDAWRDYSSLTIARDDAFGNAVRAAQFEQHRELAKIGKPVDHGEWFMSPPTVNAYYDPQMNDVNFPAGILQPPYFDPAADDAVNYGDAGGVIGHELTHAFDDEGRQFDGQGNLRDWWTKEDAKQFNDRAACVVKEYDGFVAVPAKAEGASKDDLHVNGKLTLGENLADLGGLRLAYLAYLQRAAEQHVDLSSQTDGFTPAQRFFLSYAQGWCENTRPESMRLRVEVDPHAPEEDRVNGVVENLPEFQQAFACTAKQPMVAKKPCSVW
jgi:endothelin-converting enzyme/putative endopeptidase